MEVRQAGCLMPGTIGNFVTFLTRKECKQEGKTNKLYRLIHFGCTKCIQEVNEMTGSPEQPKSPY